MIHEIDLEVKFFAKKNEAEKTWFLSLNPLVWCTFLDGEKTIYILGIEMTKSKIGFPFFSHSINMNDYLEGISSTDQ